MKTNIIPVLLLTGYLGSGKTTLLNRILSNRRGIKFAVIVNDIGEVNIDADLIQKGGIVDQKDDSLVALQNGCICCTLKMDLVGQLRDITEMERFDYIVIEASGICEPAPIAQTICSYPTMGPEFIRKGIARLDCIATVVDAMRMRDEFGNGNSLMRGNLEEDDIENLLIQQIEFCNIILLNKADEVTSEELGKIRQIIRALQPKAEIIECNYGDVDLDRIINTGMFDFDSVATSATWIKEIEGHHEEDGRMRTMRSMITTIIMRTSIITTTFIMSMSMSMNMRTTIIMNMSMRTTMSMSITSMDTIIITTTTTREAKLRNTA